MWRPREYAAIASISVTAAKTRVVPGGPVEMTYRFELLPGATLALDYKVFVQLLSADGQLLWSDDHDPSVPTSQWKIGQPVQYTRTRFLPTTGLAPVDATLHVGLYREDERLPLQGGFAEAAGRLYPVVALQIAPESERVFLIYTGGWQPDEFFADSARSWKWTQKAATASFRNPKADATLLLEYDARPDVFSGPPQQVNVYTAGQLVTAFPADSPEIVLRRIPLPAAVMGSADMVELRIEVDKVFVPAELPAGGKDTRTLGIRVYQAFVESR